MLLIQGVTLLKVTETNFITKFRLLYKFFNLKNASYNKKLLFGKLSNFLKSRFFINAVNISQRRADFFDGGVCFDGFDGERHQVDVLTRAFF
jgi:hypothetical protein